jgi:hypothetical protein
MIWRCEGPDSTNATGNAIASRLANPHRYNLDAHRRPHHGLGRAITFGLILRAALLVVDNQQRAASNGLAFEFEFDWSLHD